jgi:hypothetical protein
VAGSLWGLPTSADILPELLEPFAIALLGLFRDIGVGDGRLEAADDVGWILLLCGEG